MPLSRTCEENALPPRTTISISEGTHPEGFTMDFHTHPFYEIGYVLGGEGFYEIYTDGNANARVPASPNTLLCWDGRVPHRAVDFPNTPLNQIILIFPYDAITSDTLRPFFDKVFRTQNPYPLRNPLALAEVRALLRKMLQENGKGRYGEKDVLHALLIQIVTTIVRIALDDDHTHHETKCDPRISMVLHHLARHKDEEHTPRRYANELDLSVRRFSDLFKAATGTTFTAYVNAMRIDEAKHLLRTTEKRVSTVAFEVGYESLSHFNTIFKSLVGSTPTEYREQ